jgi:hypothetical protein
MERRLRRAGMPVRCGALVARVRMVRPARRNERPDVKLCKRKNDWWKKTRRSSPTI